jgi:hypothetical protein
MRLFAEERKMRTEQLLLTAPVTITGMVMGKFLAAFSLFLGCVAVSCVNFIPLYAIAAAERGNLGYDTTYIGPVSAQIVGCLIGVILIGAVGLNSVNFYPATDEDEQADLSVNTFSNSAKSSVVMESNDYILANGGQGIGFYQATLGSTLMQGKAFFRLTAGSGPLSLVLKFGGSATDINAVTTGTPSDDELIYDIYGRRVTEVKKGNIYIKNGKKFIVK